MLLHTGSGPTTLVSIPRDSLVNIPGFGVAKINSAYGKGGGPDGGGPELLVKTVESATGLRIDHYAEIGFLGIVNVVDAIGGVYLCVPESIKDPKAALNIKAGCQTLDKATALGYVRTRATASSDFGRVERQRAFLSAMLTKITGPSVLLNPFRLVPLATQLSSLDHRRPQRPRLEPRPARAGHAGDRQRDLHHRPGRRRRGALGQEAGERALPGPRQRPGAAAERARPVTRSGVSLRATSGPVRR